MTTALVGPQETEAVRHKFRFMDADVLILIC